MSVDHNANPPAPAQAFTGWVLARSAQHAAFAALVAGAIPAVSTARSELHLWAVLVGVIILGYGLGRLFRQIPGPRHPLPRSHSAITMGIDVATTATCWFILGRLFTDAPLDQQAVVSALPVAVLMFDLGMVGRGVLQRLVHSVESTTSRRSLAMLPVDLTAVIALVLGGTVSVAGSQLGFFLAITGGAGAMFFICVRALASDLRPETPRG